MKEKFAELIKLLTLAQIRIIDSHETVLQGDVSLGQNDNVNIETIQSLGELSPDFDASFVKFNLKYTFNFSKSENKDIFFSASYIVIVTFNTTDLARTKDLLFEKEIVNIFVTQQLRKTLWPVFRGILIDAMGRHSLPQIVLPWIK